MHFCKSEIFLILGLDIAFRKSEVICPSGHFVAAVSATSLLPAKRLTGNRSQALPPICRGEFLHRTSGAQSLNEGGDVESVSRGPDRRNLDSALLSFGRDGFSPAPRQTLGKEGPLVAPWHGRVFVCIPGRAITVATRAMTRRIPVDRRSDVDAFNGRHRRPCPI